MRMKLVVPLSVVLLTAVLAYAGGWAVVTITDVPTSAVAGEPLVVSFAVRGHGVHLTPGLPASVEAIAGEVRTRAAVRPGREPGYYTARLVIPQPGDWTLVVHSGWSQNPANATWLPLTVMTPGEMPPAFSAVEQGKRLFVAKGCVTCHRHDAIVTPSAQVSIGPALDKKTYTAEYVRQMLTNPPPARTAEGWLPRQMPDLKLQGDEVAALSAFLTASRR